MPHELWTERQFDWRGGRVDRESARMHAALALHHWRSTRRADWLGMNDSQPLTEFLLRSQHTPFG